MAASNRTIAMEQVPRALLKIGASMSTQSAGHCLHLVHSRTSRARWIRIRSTRCRCCWLAVCAHVRICVSTSISSSNSARPENVDHKCQLIASSTSVEVGFHSSHVHRTPGRVLTPEAHAHGPLLEHRSTVSGSLMSRWLFPRRGPGRITSGDPQTGYKS